MTSVRTKFRKSSMMYSYVIIIVLESIMLAGISFSLMYYVKTADLNMLRVKAYGIACNVREHILEMYSLAMLADRPLNGRYMLAAVYLNLPSRLGEHGYRIHVGDVDSDGIYDVIVDVYDVGCRAYVSCLLEMSEKLLFNGQITGLAGICSIACYIYDNGTILFTLSNSEVLCHVKS